MQTVCTRHSFIFCAPGSTCSMTAVISCLKAKVPPPPPLPSPFLLFLQVEKFGKPTWRRLVEAVKDHVGGNNCALAQKIATDHPGAPGNHIYKVMYIVIQLALITYDSFPRPKPLPAFIACLQLQIICCLPGDTVKPDSMYFRKTAYKFENCTAEIL